MFLSSLLVVVVMVVTVHTVSEYFIHNQDGVIMARAGQKVILPCRVENKASPLQWTRDGFGLGTQRGLPGFPRLSMGGDNLERDWDLVIEDVELEDEAEYECQVGDIRYKTRLEVTVPSGPPVILNGGEAVIVTEGVEAELECRSEGGKPPAKLVWGGDVVLTGQSKAVTRGEDQKTVVSVSTVRLVPVREDDGELVSCTASNIMTPGVIVRVRLDVRYKPRVNIKRDGNVREGDDLQLACNVDAKPLHSKLTWTIDGEDVTPAEDDPVLTLRNISKHEHNKHVTCTATNTVGTGDDSLVLTVNYGPRIVLQPHSVYVKEGETVHMTCQAESHPPASYTWHRLGDTKVYSFSSSLITTATNTSEGSYFCQARTSHSASEPARSILAQLLIIRRPVIVSQQTQYGGLHDMVSITCVSNHTEEETSTMWMFKDKKLGMAMDDEKHTVENTAKKNVIESRLTIHNATIENFGVYTCLMENSLGMDTMKILLINGDLAVELVVLRLVLAILGFLSFIAVAYVAFKCYQSFKNYHLAVQDQQLGLGRSPSASTATAGNNTRKRRKTESPENLPDQCLENPSIIQENVLNTLGKDFAAFYGNPHLSSYMESDDDDEDDTDSVRIRLVDDQSHQPVEMTAFYGNTRLSSHHQDDSDNGVKVRETGRRPKSVNFHTETTEFSAADDISEDPYTYDDAMMRIARDVVDDDDEDITILPETSF